MGCSCEHVDKYFSVVMQDGKEKTAQHVSPLLGVDTELAEEQWNAFAMRVGKAHYVKNQSVMTIVYCLMALVE